MEIEKKYLVKEMPEIKDLESIKIEQRYISTTDPIIRIRRWGEMFYMTYKRKVESIESVNVCDEHELLINEEIYNKLMKVTDPKFITKERYFVKLEKDLTAEIDVFKNKLEGLITVEVEFDSVEESMKFKKPDWFGEDLTNNKSYLNCNLIKYESMEDIK